MYVLCIEFVGSDDFNLYMWKIPPMDGKAWVESAHMVLRGHRSIVNQVRYNQASCIFASSGVEKIIKIWSPFPLGTGCLGGLKVLLLFMFVLYNRYSLALFVIILFVLF